ncbi:antirestriction protein ArdA [Ruminococcus difficilis]|uniref:Antirestriction protein ArdA n=1 Tax=Ruminococcus difficilis TaxID=2763069 RepID=A0A934U2Q1_9FIRM|nr:antirestriction protein ArdA [Ruminococcus difficilis]MBK6088394.1 antirestriction protein ArdA [Ruminococcus difficilis]
MINLTFNIHRYALLTDVSSPASIGRKYILSTQGCIPADDSDDKMYENIGKQLIEEGKFKLTEYGILVVNDTPFEKVYDGLNFPEYHYYDSFLAVDLEHEGKKEFVAIAEDPESLNTAAERLGVESPEDCDVTINSYHVDMEPIIPAFQQILEVEGVIKLSQLASELANEKMDWAKLRAVADYSEVRSAKNLNIIADRLDEFVYIPKANDEDDVGRYYVNDYKDGNVYSLCIDMEEYFDFQAFGEYMMEEYHGKFIEDGYVCVSDYGCGEFLDELEDEPEYDQGEGVIMT